MDMVLTDRVTPAANNMRKAINGLMTVMEKADSRFRGVFNDAGLKNVTKQIASTAKLTEAQQNKLDKLQHNLLSKQKERARLEKEIADAGHPIAKRSKAVADANANLKHNLLEQDRLNKVIARDKQKLIGWNKAVNAAMNDQNISAYRLKLLVKSRDAFEASINSKVGRVAKLKRSQVGLEEELRKAEGTVGRLLQEKADKQHKINGLQIEERELARQIEEIRSSAASNAEKAAQKQADAIKKQMDAVEAAERKAIDAAKAQDVDKWKKFDSNQNSMRNLIVQAEERERREAAAIEAAEQKKIASVNKEYEAKKHLWQKEQSKQQEITRERLTQEFAIEQAQQRYGKAVERANALYTKANQKVRELGNTIDHNNKAQVAELKGAEKIAAVRGKIVTELNRLKAVQIELNYLELKGETTSKRVNKLRQTEASIKRTIAGHGRNIKRIESRTAAEIERQTRAQRKLNTEKQKTVRHSNQVWAALKRGTTAYLGVQSLGGVINTSDSLTMAKARMNVVGDGVHSTEELMSMIYGASMRSRSGYLDMAASVSKVAMQAGSLFRTDGKQNNAAIVRFMENYNKMAAISGATQQQTSAAMLQIVQALSSGELRGDELRSVLENMPVVADYIAKKMGVARDQILSLGHEGKISAETLRDAVMGATEDLDEKMKKMPYTWGQVWTIFKNAALKAFEPVLNGISAILKNEKFLEFANGIGQALVIAGKLAYPVFNAIGTVIGWVYDKLKVMYNFVKDNISTIAPIFIGIASALALYYSWVGLVWLATKSWAAIQAVLNAVMAMTPLMWIVAGIGAIIAAVYLLVDEGTSGTGVLVGCAYWLWEVICNIGKWIANMFCGIVQEIVNRWNWMCNNTSIIFDNIGTFWDNLWINCRIGLNNFVAWAIGKLASLAESVSPIAEALGVDVSGLNKVAKKAADKADRLERNKGSYKSLIPWSERGTVDWEKYKYGDLSEAYDRGYKVGAQFEEDVKSKFKGLSEYFGGDDQNDFYKALSGGFDNPAVGGATGNPTLDKISGDTGDIAKNTGKSEEDFSYLRELAERESINKYTLTDLKIDMTNNNNISNGVDSDSVMRRLAKQLSDAVLSTAEGITPW